MELVFTNMTFPNVILSYVFVDGFGRAYYRHIQGTQYWQYVPA